jgi:hypothetical protein
MCVLVVQKEPDIYEVAIDGRVTTTHLVIVTDLIHESLTNLAISKEELVTKSFGFLLEREPNTSILSQFKIEEISKYFPDYESVASNWLK